MTNKEDNESYFALYRGEDPRPVGAIRESVVEQVLSDFNRFSPEEYRTEPISDREAKEIRERIIRGIKVSRAIRSSYSEESIRRTENFFYHASPVEEELEEILGEEGLELGRPNEGLVWPNQYSVNSSQLKKWDGSEGWIFPLTEPIIFRTCPEGNTNFPKDGIVYDRWVDEDYPEEQDVPFEDLDNDLILKWVDNPEIYFEVISFEFPRDSHIELFYYQGDLHHSLGEVMEKDDEAANFTDLFNSHFKVNYSPNHLFDNISQVLREVNVSLKDLVQIEGQRKEKFRVY